MQVYIYLFQTTKPAKPSFDYDGFHTHLEVSLNKNYETAKATVRDIRMFLSETPGDDETDTSKLLSLRHLECFKKYMKDVKRYKPTTVTEKLRRIKLAIKYATRDVEDQDLYYRANRVIDAVNEWCHALGKDIGLQRREHGIVLREKLPQMLDPNEFLDDYRVCTYMICYYNLYSHSLYIDKGEIIHGVSGH